MRTIWSVVTARGRLTALLGAALLAAGLVWDYPLVAALGGALLLVVLVELVSVLVAGDIVVHREVTPAVVVRHDPCEGALHLTGRRRQGLVRVDASDSVDGTLVPVELPEGVRGGAVSVRYPIPTPRRGLLAVGPVHLRRYGLSGMAASSREVGSVDRVRVLPRRVPIASVMPGRRRATAGGDRSDDFGGTDLVGLHEYAMGDDLRRLHWATSARTGSLMVREDADPSEPHVCVLLDDRVSSYYGAERPGDCFEEAVELTAALCRVSVERGHPLRFATLSGRHEVIVPGSPTRTARRESRELDWLFAEVVQVADDRIPGASTSGYDVAVTVTGVGADQRRLGLLLADVATATVAVVDERPMVGAEQQAGVLVLRGATSYSLAAAWDEAATR